jgi:hypothetical protein
MMNATAERCREFDAAGIGFNIRCRKRIQERFRSGVVRSQSICGSDGGNWEREPEAGRAVEHFVVLFGAFLLTPGRRQK